MEYIAVEGCTIEAGIDVGGAFVSSGQCTISGNPYSSKVKAKGKKVLKGTVQVAVSGYSDTGISNGATVPPALGTIVGNAQKNKAEGDFVVLEGATGAATLVGTVPGTTTSVTKKVTLKVTDANQTKVKGT